jgi:hypothetical protein
MASASAGSLLVRNIWWADPCGTQGCLMQGVVATRAGIPTEVQVRKVGHLCYRRHDVKSVQTKTVVEIPLAAHRHG